MFLKTHFCFIVNVKLSQTIYFFFVTCPVILWKFVDVWSQIISVCILASQIVTGFFVHWFRESSALILIDLVLIHFPFSIHLGMYYEIFWMKKQMHENKNASSADLQIHWELHKIFWLKLPNFSEKEVSTAQSQNSLHCRNLGTWLII